MAGAENTNARDRGTSTPLKSLATRATLVDMVSAALIRLALGVTVVDLRGVGAAFLAVFLTLFFAPGTLAACHSSLWAFFSWAPRRKNRAGPSKVSEQ